MGTTIFPLKMFKGEDPFIWPSKQFRVFLFMASCGASYLVVYTALCGTSGVASSGQQQKRAQRAFALGKQRN